jgi:hypothetical protein
MNPQHPTGTAPLSPEASRKAWERMLARMGPPLGVRVGRGAYVSPEYVGKVKVVK